MWILFVCIGCIGLYKQYLTKVEVNVRKKIKHVLKINSMFIISREPSTMRISYGMWTYMKCFLI